MEEKGQNVIVKAFLSFTSGGRPLLSLLIQVSSAHIFISGRCWALVGVLYSALAVSTPARYNDNIYYNIIYLGID